MSVIALRTLCLKPLTQSSNLNSAIVTIAVGPTQRLFAAHEDVLCKSPYFAQACRAQFFETSGKRIDLPTEEPEVFSAVLEYLYKGDYTPRLAYDKKRCSWFLEDGGAAGVGETTVNHNGVGGPVLKDTVIYVRLLSFHLHMVIVVLISPLVYRPPLLPPRTPTPRPQKARPPVRRPMQHHPLFCPLRLLAHTAL